MNKGFSSLSESIESLNLTIFFFFSYCAQSASEQRVAGEETQHAVKEESCLRILGWKLMSSNFGGRELWPGPARAMILNRPIRVDAASTRVKLPELFKLQA
ncbi:hypothetical protein SLE2022_312860 [Rubroshorea leprosula]